MKELFDVIKHYGIQPLVYGVGLITLGLFGLSLIPSLAFVPKMLVYWILTH